MQLRLDWERKPEKIQACLDLNPDLTLLDSTCWKVSSIRLNGPLTYFILCNKIYTGAHNPLVYNFLGDI